MAEAVLPSLRLSLAYASILSEWRAGRALVERLADVADSPENVASGYSGSIHRAIVKQLRRLDAIRKRARRQGPETVGDLAVLVSVLFTTGLMNGEFIDAVKCDADRLLSAA